MSRQNKLFTEPKPGRRRRGKKWDISVEEFRAIIGADDDELEDRDAAKAWVAKNQLGRRNLTPFQRAELGLVLEPELKKKAKENERSGGKVSQQGSTISSNPVDTRKEIAKAANVSEDTIRKTKAILEKADAETLDKVRSGKNHRFLVIQTDDFFVQIIESKLGNNADRKVNSWLPFPVNSTVSKPSSLSMPTESVVRFAWASAINAKRRKSKSTSNTCWPQKSANAHSTTKRRSGFPVWTVSSTTGWRP